jgi:hypothetical protein
MQLNLKQAGIKLTKMAKFETELQQLQEELKQAVI